MPGRLRHHALGIGLAAFSAVCYAWMPIFAREAYRAGASPTDLLSLRFLFALPLFWGPLILARPRVAAVPPLRALLFVTVGVFFGLASVCMFHAYRLIPASVAVLLLYVYPALVALWARLLRKEALGSAGIISLALTFLGVALTLRVSAGDLRSVSAAGVALAVAAGLFFSVYTLLAQDVVAGMDPLVFAAWSVTATFALVALLAPPWEALRRAAPPVITSALRLATVSTFLAIWAYAKGICSIGATRAAVVSSLEIPGVVILSRLFLGERLTVAQMLGGTLILAGVVLIQWSGRGSTADNGAEKNRVDTVRA